MKNDYTTLRITLGDVPENILELHFSLLEAKLNLILSCVSYFVSVFCVSGCTSVREVFIKKK